MSDVGAMEGAISQWEKSGSSLRQFGTREGISYSKLIYWRRKLRGGSAKVRKTPGNGKSAAAQLVPVKVVTDEGPSSLSATQFTAWLANGVSIDVPAGFDERELRSLVTVLAAC